MTGYPISSRFKSLISLSPATVHGVVFALPHSSLICLIDRKVHPASCP